MSTSIHGGLGSHPPHAITDLLGRRTHGDIIADHSRPVPRRGGLAAPDRRADGSWVESIALRAAIAPAAVGPIKWSAEPTLLPIDWLLDVTTGSLNHAGSRGWLRDRVGTNNKDAYQRRHAGCVVPEAVTS